MCTVSALRAVPMPMTSIVALPTLKIPDFALKGTRLPTRNGTMGGGLRQAGACRLGVLSTAAAPGQPVGTLLSPGSLQGQSAARVILLRHDQVGAGLEPCDHFFHGLRRVHEIGMQCDRAVALRPIGTIER